MAERNEEGPFFYHGFFGIKSIKSEDLTKAERIEYRQLYRKLISGKGGRYQETMLARKILRSMLNAR